MVYRFIRRRLFKFVLICLCAALLWTFLGFTISEEEDDNFPHDLEYDVFIDETKEEQIIRNKMCNHLMKMVIQEKVEDKRKRERPSISYMDNIKKKTDQTESSLCNNAEDRKRRHEMVKTSTLSDTIAKGDAETTDFHIPLDEEMIEDLIKSRKRTNKPSGDSENPKDPIILWWTEFTKEPGQVRKCGEKQCFFTNDRKYMSHDSMKVFMFYGTDFNPKDLPLPRQEHHEWALLHEESPKNNLLLSHGDALSLFNHTSTFRRESDFPLSSQHLMSLEWLEQDTYMKTVSKKNRYQDKDNLSPVVFVQSDCDPPSDRDEYVKQLMRHVSVDSYGQCLNNKKLPEKIVSPLEGMAHTDFYELLSHYKFAIAMENAVCKDYMTEKLWRPLMVGTVPIVFGSPDVRDFLPDNDSALLVKDFKSAEHLGLYIQHLNTNDLKYDKLRSWKTSGITNDYLRKVVSSRPWQPDDIHNWEPGHVNFVEAFECFVCNRVHDNLEREVNGERIIRRWANTSHYGCPKRKKFDGSGKYVIEAGWLDFWKSEWERQLKIAKALQECVKRKLPFCWDFIKERLQKKDF